MRWEQHGWMLCARKTETEQAQVPSEKSVTMSTANRVKGPATKDTSKQTSGRLFVLCPGSTKGVHTM
jgi:hypothetical protein